MKFLHFILFVIALFLGCYFLMFLMCQPAVSFELAPELQKYLDSITTAISVYQKSSSDIEAKSEEVAPKTVMRFVNTSKTVTAAGIIDNELCLIDFTFGDELECIESTLDKPYVQILLSDGYYVIENKYLSVEPASKFKIVKDAGVFSLTAYAATGNRCANGKWPRLNHTVAAHSKQFPLGTKLYIEGYGIFTVDDRGGFPMGVIDIYLGDRKTCIRFGRRKAHVYVIEWGDNVRYKPEPKK